MLLTLAVLAAFVIPTLSPAMAVLALNWVFGWGGQWLKAHKEFPSLLAHSIMVAVGLGLYSLVHHPTADDVDWLTNAFAWATAPSGASSILASAGLASKTDSK